MIIVKLMGGLGNQMFQYALGRNLALKNKTELKLDTSWFLDRQNDGATARSYQLDEFKIEENFATPKENAELRMTGWRDYFRPKNKKRRIRQEKINFEPWVLNAQGNIYLEGYWQSEKYFKDVEETIKKDFELKNELSTTGKGWLERINGCRAVSVHVRRGDYSNDRATKAYHGECTKEYYVRAGQVAVNGFESPVFFVFSDDLDWAKENIKLPGQIFLVSGEYDRPAEEIILQSSCRRHIIANSTFGWWGAWLDNKPGRKVWAPKKWFANAEAEKQAGDIVPDDWLKI